MKHTQGPWAVSNYYAGKASISGKDWGGFATVVTRLDDDESDSVEGLANARLISVAPDMYTALQSMVLNYAQFGRVTENNVRDAARILLEIGNE